LPNRAVDEACLDQPARPVNSPRTLSEGSRRIPQPLQRTDKAIPLTKTSLLSCCASQKTQKPPGYCADCPQRSPNAAKHTRLLDQQGSNDRPPTRPDTPDQASTAQAQTIHCPEKQTNALASVRERTHNQSPGECKGIHHGPVKPRAPRVRSNGIDRQRDKERRGLGSLPGSEAP
jgi:hypothetical protein